MTVEEKIPVVQITTGYSEAGALYEKQVFDSFQAFDARFGRLHREQEELLGHYKTDFVVEWEDGAMWSGRFDIGSDRPTLSQHLQSAAARIKHAKEFLSIHSID